MNAQTGDGLDLRRFARDSSYNLIRQIWVIVIGLMISVSLARGLGAEGRGIYALALLLPQLLVTFFNMGVSPATVYYVSRGEREIEATIRGNIALAMWMGAGTMLIGLLLALFGGEQLFPGVPLNLLLLSLLVIPISLHSSYLLAILQGMQDFRAFNWVNMTPQLISLALIWLLVWRIPGGVFGAILAYLGGSLAALIVLMIVLSRHAKSKRMMALWIDMPYTRQVMSYGLKAHISNIAAFLNYRADIFLLNFYLGASMVGIYSVAVGLAERIWILSGSVATVMLPRIAAMDGVEVKRRQLTPLIARHVLWVSLIAGAVIWILAQWGIVFLYSEAYRTSAVALRILLPGIVLGSMSKILSNDIAGRGRPGITSQLATLAFVVNIIANLLLIPQLGIAGAALATTISYSLLALLQLFVYCRLTDVPWLDVVLLKREDWRRFRMVLRLAIQAVRDHI